MNLAADIDEERELQLFGKLTGINPEELQGMDLIDYHRMQDAYGDFLSRPGPIAGTSA